MMWTASDDNNEGEFRRGLPYILAFLALCSATVYFGDCERIRTEAKSAREVQEWRQAHKEMVSCDFGRGFKFSFKSQEPEDVPEALRPALTAGLASGACYLEYPQS
jgi:hypothetical protein